MSSIVTCGGKIAAIDKDLIRAIKWHMKNEMQKHYKETFTGTKLDMKDIRIEQDGRFRFIVRHFYPIDYNHPWKEDYVVEGDLNDYPLEAVKDALDVVIMIFLPIHKELYEHAKKYMDRDMERFQKRCNHLVENYYKKDKINNDRLAFKHLEKPTDYFEILDI